MTNETDDSGTYSIPYGHSDAIVVVTESNKGKRGWVMSYVADDPETDYSIYDPAYSIEWDDGQTPREAGVGGGRESHFIPPTQAVNEYLKTTYCLVIHDPTTGKPRTYGLREGYEAKMILLRALKREKRLI